MPPHKITSTPFSFSALICCRRRHGSIDSSRRSVTDPSVTSTINTLPAQSNRGEIFVPKTGMAIRILQHLEGTYGRNHTFQEMNRKLSIINILSLYEWAGPTREVALLLPFIRSGVA
jgi:hypothetical protein